MQRWRETCRELRQQDDDLAWAAMSARSALTPLVQRQQKAPNTLVLATAIPSPTSRRSGPR